MISQATKILTRTCQSVTHLPSSSHIQPMVLVQTRFKHKCIPEGKKKSKKLMTAATIAVVGTTVAIIAAKNDEDFREWSKEHIPTLDEMVKVVYEEEEPYLEFLARAHKELTTWLKSVVYNAFQGIKQTGGASQKGISGTVSQVCEESKKPYIPPESAFLASKKEGEMTDGKEDVSEKSKTEKLPKHIQELKTLEDKVSRAAQDTIQSYHAVVCALREQANLIDNLEQLISKHDSKVWEKLQKKMKDEQKFLDKAEDGLKSVQNNAKKLKTRLEEDPQLTDDVKNRAKNNLTIVEGDVKRAKENLEKEKTKLVLSKRAWDKVKQARMHFTEELETLFPNVWLNDEKLNLPLDALDPFVQSVLNNIQYLEMELFKLQTVRDAEVASAIERVKSADDPESLINVSVNLEASKEKRLREEETQKTMLTHQAKCDKNARTMMKQQAEVYKDLKQEAISMKEREVERKMLQLEEERLAEVRAHHKMEIAKMVGRIQGANEAISQRGDKDKDQQEKQQFWSAAQSLLSAVKPIGVAAKGKEPKPLKNEITNVSKVAPEQDELVETMLASIPQQATERGVESEPRLRERFIMLEKEARKVAAVPEGEVSLLQLFLSRLQSKLYMNEAIPQAELSNEPIDVEELNNYEVLCRARYYVDNGEFDQAVRYLNLLKGPCAKVASDWIRDVIVYLETRQAAESLLAYASASSIQG